MKRANWLPPRCGLRSRGRLRLLPSAGLAQRRRSSCLCRGVGGAGRGLHIISRRLAKSARELRAAVVRADESLATARAAEIKYRSIFENAGEGIFQAALDGRYLAANSALARLFGYASPEELIRAVASVGTQHYVDPTRREAFLQEMQRRGEVSDFESQIRRCDGSLAWISENAYAVRDKDGVATFYEGTVADITDRKQNETEGELRTQRELRPPALPARSFAVRQE